MTSFRIDIDDDELGPRYVESAIAAVQQAIRISGIRRLVTGRDVPVDKEYGVGFIQCALCVQEWKDHKAVGESPRSYARLSVGWTELGFQIWCVRHETNVAHIDFEGEKHPANLARKGDEE